MNYLLAVLADAINLILTSDITVNHWLNLLRSEYYTKIFLAVTALGGSSVIIGLLIIAGLLFWLSNKKTFIAPLFISVAGSNLVSDLSKLFFQRPRPLNPVYFETTFSFPSGHATAAIAYYGFLIYFCFKNTKRSLNRAIFMAGGLFLMIAIGFSRLYLGVHYLSDVIAGYLLGGLWLTLGIILAEYSLKKIKKA